MTWTQWLGLPHRFGADPEDGQAADCVIMAVRVLQELGHHHPPIEEQWWALAAANEWAELRCRWEAATRPVEAASEGALTLINNGHRGLGVAVVVAYGLLFVHHRAGVAWLPLGLVRQDLQYRVVP
jgi:hypothetical protein